MTYGQLAREVIKHWWAEANLSPPFQPGTLLESRKVFDSTGSFVCDCETDARAQVVSTALSLVHWEIEHGVDI